MHFFFSRAAVVFPHFFKNLFWLCVRVCCRMHPFQRLNSDQNSTLSLPLAPAWPLRARSKQSISSGDLLRFVLREPLNFPVCLFSPVQTTTQTEGGSERERREERGKGRAERGKGGQEMRREKEEKGRKFAKLTVSHSIDTASKERKKHWAGV